MMTASEKALRKVREAQISTSSRTPQGPGIIMKPGKWIQENRKDLETGLDVPLISFKSFSL